MASATHPQGTGPHTWDDFVKLADDDRRELIEGELVEVEVPSDAHESVVAEIIAALVVWKRSRKWASVMASGSKIRVSERRGVMPDVVARYSETAYATGRPDLVVEVISPSSRRYDRVTKLGYYASLGAPEYWIVDPDASTLERLLLREGRYIIEESLGGDAVFRPATLDGLEIRLADLWAAAEDGRRNESL